jgi:hypothetical protein
MNIRAQNGYIAHMAKQLESGISNNSNLFVEVYLDSMDCSVEAELTNLRWLQNVVASQPDVEVDMPFDVLKKWLYGWKEADKCLACLGLKDSAAWRNGYYKAGRPQPGLKS